MTTTLTVSAAWLERTTAIHYKTGARILDNYVRFAPLSDDPGFPVSGDMLAMIRRGSRHALERRRRRAARVITEHEVTQ